MSFLEALDRKLFPDFYRVKDEYDALRGKFGLPKKKGFWQRRSKPKPKNKEEPKPSAIDNAMKFNQKFNEQIAKLEEQKEELDRANARVARRYLPLRDESSFSHLLSMEAGGSDYACSAGKKKVLVPHGLLKELRRRPGGEYLVSCSNYDDVVRLDGSFTRLSKISQNQIKRFFDETGKQSAVFVVKRDDAFSAKKWLQDKAELLGTEGIAIVYDPKKREMMSFGLDDANMEEKVYKTKLFYGRDTDEMSPEPAVLSKYRELFPGNTAFFGKKTRRVDDSLRAKFDANPGSAFFAPLASGWFQDDGTVFSNPDPDLADIRYSNIMAGHYPWANPAHFASHKPVLVKGFDSLTADDFNWFDAKGYRNFGIYDPARRELVQVKTNAGGVKRFYDADVRF